MPLTVVTTIYKKLVFHLNWLKLLIDCKKPEKKISEVKINLESKIPFTNSSFLWLKQGDAK